MKKVLLCILDGFGMREERHGNAIMHAKKPNFDYLWHTYPHSFLEASGKLVGLPAGQMGNSEVGHTNIGAGRIVYQPLELINKKIETEEFFHNEYFLKAIEHARSNNSKLHIYGMLSDGGIHSHINHILALLDLCKKEDFTNVYLHMFTDGRDTFKDVSYNYFVTLEEKIKEVSLGKIASISGRYYAMDRDKRWDRLKKAYDVIVNAIGEVKNSPKEIIEQSYAGDITDEFILPTLITREGRLENGDSIIFANFRPDRATELLTSISNPEFNDMEVRRFNDVMLVTMMPCVDTVISTPAFKEEELNNTLGEYISNLRLKQLRIAETEKYAHVTYFFDGGLEKDYTGCDKVLIASPKEVATYDLKPEMSAYDVTDTLLQKMDEDYDLIILNFANCDMVGHTGNMDATIKAVEVVDENLGKIYHKAKALDYTMIIIADHGNADIMLDSENRIVTSHTTSKVPCIITDTSVTVKEGKLGDIAPTILKIMDLEIPKEMTGEELI